VRVCTHEHPHALDAARSLDRRLAVSIGLNALIVAVEIAGGLASGSLALLSDALHNLSDVVALALALVARVLGRRPPSLRHTYGLGRLEDLAALLNSATLLVVSTLIGREAILRLSHPEPVKGGLMLIVAAIGLLANLVSMLLLRGHDHSDLNMRGAFLHLMQDTLSSVVVVLAALFSQWRFGAYMDPMASILVIVLILRSSWGLLNDTTRILLEGTPPGLDMESLQEDIQSTFAVRDLHHVHVCELSSGYRLLTAHVRLNEMPLCEVEALLMRVRELLSNKWSVGHATLEPEINACVSGTLIHSPSVQTKERYDH
jgi:cobalt-zinc-cadmium efflux system protein